MAASCLTFLLCSNVTVSSYSFMVIADRKAPAHTLHTSGFKASLCSSYIFCLTWSGCRSDFPLFADSDGDKFAALLAIGGRGLCSGIRRDLDQFFVDFQLLCFVLTYHDFLFPFHWAYFLALESYGFLSNYFSTFLAVTIKTFLLSLCTLKWQI